MSSRTGPFWYTDRARTYGTRCEGGLCILFVLLCLWLLLRFLFLALYRFVGLGSIRAFAFTDFVHHHYTAAGQFARASKSVCVCVCVCTKKLEPERLESDELDTKRLEPERLESDDLDTKKLEPRASGKGSMKPKHLCPVGHRLRWMVCHAVVGGFCDLCRGNVFAGEGVMSCRRCDYDVCSSCFD